MSQSLVIRHRIVQNIILHQSITQILQTRLSLRIRLIQRLTGDIYKPRAECPNCGKRLKVADILRGFNRDPQDFTTQCPKCRERFTAHLTCNLSFGSQIHLVFFCPAQALNQLTERLAELSPDKITTNEPSLYHSLIFHFGGLKAAFSKVGIKYKYTEKVDWKKKVIPFLGKMSDSEIAKCARVSTATIRNYRVKLGICSFSK